MVLQFLLPKEGGGSLRRFLGIRQRLRHEVWNDPRPLRGPMPLFDFRLRDDAADLRSSLIPDRNRGLFGDWRVSDDSVIGGFSTSRMEFNEGVDTTTEEKNPSAPSSPPFLRWSGTLSTKINKKSHLARNVTRSGFAAILSPEYPLSAPLGNKYRALEICCRTDGRTYAVNLHVETMFPEDMYQGFIVGGGKQQQNVNDDSLEKNSTDDWHGYDSTLDSTNSTINSDEEDDQKSEEQPESSLDIRQHLKNRQKYIGRRDPDLHPYHGHPPAGFQRLLLPFTDFALTSRGRLRHAQRDLDGSVNIESIGFTLMDGQDGDFCFDLVSLRAVNVLQGEVVGTVEDDAREEELRNSLRPSGEKEETEDTETVKSDSKS
ncbi:hypothetical protein ACHAXR_006480 [Thalassiosira sp. AJA248-18]